MTTAARFVTATVLLVTWFRSMPHSINVTGQ
jgi:hypothetical protein